MTSNPLWPEIVEALLSGQSAFDRPICKQVFKHRFDVFLANLRSGKYFDGKDEFKECNVRRKLIYKIRGLSHVHIIKLFNTQIPSEHDACSEWVDS